MDSAGIHHAYSHFSLWSLTLGQSVTLFFFFFKFYLFIYFWLHWVFIAARGPFSSCGERGPLFAAVHGLLIAMASLVAEHRP